MADLPPLPKPDNGSILVGREEICLGHSDEAMRAYALAAIKAEREACAMAVETAPCWHRPDLAAAIRSRLDAWAMLDFKRSNEC